MRALVSLYKRVLLFFIKSDIIANALFNLRLMTIGYRKNEILILATITKTGTHYLRFLIAYYIKMKHLKNEGQSYKIAPDDFIVDRYYTNSWHTSYTFITKFNKSTEKLKIIGLSDFPRSHMPFRAKSWRNARVLHTYRDLREQAFISYKMKYECDVTLENQYRNFEQLYEDTFEDNYLQYSSFSEQRYNSSNCLRIDFRQISKHPSLTLALIIQWLGYEPDIELCNLSAELCQFTPSILVGGGEKWHRISTKNVKYDKLNEFIEKNKMNGAIGILNAD